MSSSSSPASSSAPAGFSTPWERRLSLLALSVSWLAIVAYLVLLVTNIVRFFTERAATASYPALLAWWLAFPGQTGDGGLPLALLLAAFAVAFLILLLPATRAILLLALWTALPGWIQQFFIWTPNVRDPGYPRTGIPRAIRAVLYVTWVVLVAPTVFNFAPSLLALLTNGTSPTAENILRALNQGVFLTLTPEAGLLVFAVEAALTLAAAAALVDWRVEEGMEKRRARPTPPQEEYGLLPVREMAVDAIQLGRYVPGVYVPQQDAATGDDARTLTVAALRLATKRNVAAPASADTSIGVCIFGKPMEGKTRLAWDALHLALDVATPEWTFLLWKRSPTYQFDVRAHPGERFALWLDDLQKYAANPAEVSRIQQLLLDLRAAKTPFVVVATCRDGGEEDQARAQFADLLSQLRPIRPRDLTPEQTATLRQALAAKEVRVFDGDGTPGSVLFSVEFMRERYQRLGQSEQMEGRGAKGENAQRLLRAMKLLQKARIYDFPLARVRAVAVERFNLPEGPGALLEAVDVLEKEGFVHYRSAPASGPAAGGEGMTGTLEPVADVYLEQAIPDYPNAGHRMTEDWPRLLTILQEQRDGDALNSLGIAFGELTVGYDPARPETLRPNKDYSVAAYRLALEVYTRAAAPADWAMTQNNLGNALGGQANLAEGDERARLLAEAIAAYRLALEVYTRAAAPIDWAGTQNNLGTALGDQANLAEGDERARLLAEAIAAYQLALQVRTRAAAPTYWAGTTYNLAFLYRDLADAAPETSSACAALRDARACLDAALPILRSDHPATVPDAEGLGQEINEKLTTLGCP
jgi:tetratricopeptide (TPR) repeat protein